MIYLELIPFSFKTFFSVSFPILGPKYNLKYPTHIAEVSEEFEDLEVLTFFATS